MGYGLSTWWTRLSWGEAEGLKEKDWRFGYRWEIGSGMDNMLLRCTRTCAQYFRHLYTKTSSTELTYITTIRYYYRTLGYNWLGQRKSIIVDKEVDTSSVHVSVKVSYYSPSIKLLFHHLHALNLYFPSFLLEISTYSDPSCLLWIC